MNRAIGCAPMNLAGLRPALPPRQIPNHAEQHHRERHKEMVHV